MDNASHCFDMFARGTVTGFTIFGALSFFLFKKRNRFSFAVLGAGIGSGYGAFDCSQTFMHFSVNDNIKRTFGIDFNNMLTSSAKKGDVARESAPNPIDEAMDLVRKLEAKAAAN